MWRVEVAHEVGHILLGTLMAGELAHASADADYGDGGTRFRFPPRLKSAGDGDRLAFASALYDVSGVAGEYAFSDEPVDLSRSSDDFAKFQDTFRLYQTTDAFRWAKSAEFAATVLSLLAEQALRDHEELARYVGGLLKSRNAITHVDLTPFGKLPSDLAPGQDWMAWFMATAARASARLAQEERSAFQREVFNARHQVLHDQMATLAEMQRHGTTR